MTHCSLVLAAHRAALPRVVSALHARGLDVRHLHVEDGNACVLVDGPAAHRAVVLLARLVDVVEVVETTACVRPPSRPTVHPARTRFLVSRQPLRPTG